MKKFKEKGFTLIELIAVLVIMAIIALIVTPLVMNIIRKARVSADRRSVDAYGRSIELAIAGYLLDNGKFPTSIDQLTIEYSGNEVVCETTQINTDSSVYLAGCTVAGRSTGDYTYGEDKIPQAPTYTTYQVGDEVTYNNINYYVIKDSDTTEESVTLLKAEPLSYEEVTTYSAGTGAQTSNLNGYGGMQYHSDSNVYSTSYVKTTVDAWAAEKVPSGLQEARLITYEELITDLNCINGSCSNSSNSWLYSNNYWYWTMSSWNDSSYRVWYVNYDGSLYDSYVGSNNYGAVRTVIVLSKSVL